MRPWLPLLVAFVLAAPACRNAVGDPPGGEGEGDGAGTGEGEGEGEGECVGPPEPAFRVFVIDNVTSFRVCDANVTVTPSGGVATALSPEGAGQDCLYQGANEAPGTYAVRVTCGGYNDFNSSGQTVTSDGCHVSTRELTVQLTPL